MDEFILCHLLSFALFIQNYNINGKEVFFLMGLTYINKMRVRKSIIYGSNIWGIWNILAKNIWGIWNILAKNIWGIWNILTKNIWGIWNLYVSLRSKPASYEKKNI
ncbi:hypothetical protein ACTNCZ_12340 [Segatella copri]|uniref:hypothetical protein n=1 Tax=Segatella copri TaxID=165179 RepID=UPI003F8A984D